MCAFHPRAGGDPFIKNNLPPNGSPPTRGWDDTSNSPKQGNVCIPLSLYIHLPWCVRKCPYCDFNSHEIKNSLPEELYIAALLKDLENQLPKIWGRRLISIFFGGGTPSLFSAQGIEKILSSVHRLFNFGPDIEITLEANPGTLDEKSFHGFKTAGINRLSIGLQSLQNDKLKTLGRIHHRDDALRAIESAVHAGFQNFNLDLMHGLPDQSIPDAIADLQDALQFSPPHVSWYQLTIEPQTFFHKNPPTLPPDDILFDIQEQGKNVIAQHGLQQYEVSAYSLPGKQCVHNLNYWEFGDYIGIGAGAHSKITNIAEGKIVRHSNVKNPKDYLDPTKSLIENEKVLSQSDIIFEFMLNALRLTQGVTTDLFLQRTGLGLDTIEPILQKAKAQKLLMVDSHRLCATELGRRFLNDLVQMFLI
ncbi:MAG TPA: radical SAM family heme chaperone HemW [Gammaproteobacteria bacterium]|nr:radical SAM family heme chaperone HemW [Gammaproteobacteria bacterium]